MPKEVKFNLDLARFILEGKIKAKIFSVDGHDMKLKEVHEDKAILTYVNQVQRGGDGPWEDKSRDIEVDYRGYFCGDKFRAVSVSKILVYED